MKMNIVLLLLLGVLLSRVAFSQSFYIGCDSVMDTRNGYRTINALIANVELYQDTSSNQLMLVSNLPNRKIIYPIYYKVIRDLATEEDSLWLIQDEFIKEKIGNKKRINQVKKYRNFIKIDPVKDSMFISISQNVNDGIDHLENLWRVIDSSIPCDLYIGFKDNIPRHSFISYHYLEFDLPCLDLKLQSTNQKSD